MNRFEPLWKRYYQHIDTPSYELYNKAQQKLKEEHLSIADWVREKVKEIDQAGLPPYYSDPHELDLERLPPFPCYLWDSSECHWSYFRNNPFPYMLGSKEVFTHWMPPPPAPPPRTRKGEVMCPDCGRVYQEHVCRGVPLSTLVEKNYNHLKDRYTWKRPEPDDPPVCPVLVRIDDDNDKPTVIIARVIHWEKWKEDPETGQRRFPFIELNNGHFQEILEYCEIPE